MSLKLTKRNGSDHWYIRGTVRGKSVFETSGTNDKAASEEIRIKREAQLLEESIHGRTATVTFAEAASSYIASGGSARFLGDFKNGAWTGLIGEFGTRKLNSMTQSELDAAAVKLFPKTQTLPGTGSATRRSFLSGIMQSATSGPTLANGLGHASPKARC
jgi:integrase/recombinase XerD